MSDDVFHTMPTGETVEVAQPSTEADPQGDVAEGTGASESVESEQQAAERIVQERQVRQRRAQHNQRAAFERLARERDEFKAALLSQVEQRRAPEPVQAPVDRAPRRDDFSTWEEYEDARLDWRFELKTKATQEKQARELANYLQHAQRQQQDEQLTSAHGQRVAEFAKAVPDFAEVTDRDDVEIPNAAAEAIKNMPNSPQIVYAIGRDETLAHRMRDMTATQQAAFVGQLSAALMYQRPQVSKAPAPGVPVGGRSSPSPSLETANYDEFVKLRRKQIAARR